MKSLPQKVQRILAFDTIIILMLIDQLSKWYVIEQYFRPLSYDASGPTMDFITWLTKIPQEQFPFYRSEICSVFSLVMVWNKGVSFGMFASTQAFMPYVLGVVALGMSVLFLCWMWRATSLLAALPLAMIVSGALSNVWDRVRFGAVADFLDFHIGATHWPAFNIADSCIVLGVAGLALHTLLSGKSMDGKTVSDQA